MATPIYKFFKVRPTEAFYALSQEDQQKLFAKIGELLNSVGGKVVISCNSGWANEEWPYFGVEEFPDIEAIQRLYDLQQDAEWFRYVEAETLLGTKLEESQE
jgi:hypothetical protein